MSKETNDVLQKRTLEEVTRAERWNVNQFALARKPYTLGIVEDKTCLDRPALFNEIEKRASIPLGVVVEFIKSEHEFYKPEGVWIKDMPIKFPNTEFRIPETVWNNFGNILAQAIAYENRINPNIQNSYVYATFDQSNVERGGIQRIPGTHIDGYQKQEIEPQVIQHQIAVTNFIPTQFYVQPLDVDKLKLDKNEFFEELKNQCDDRFLFSPKPYDLHLLNAYCPHKPGTADRKGFRTFVRISVSDIPFMSSGNTESGLFDYSWDAASKKKFYDSIKKVNL